MQQLIFSRLNHNKRKRRLSNLSNEQPDEDSKDDNVNVPSLKKQKKEQPCAIPYLSVVPECRKRVHRMTDLMQSEDVSIGDLVQLSTSFHPDRLRGVVRFIGEVHALRYTYDQIFGHHYFGIELFGAEGDTDGTIEKEYYFHAEPKHGVFVKRDKIEKTITLNWSVPRLTIDDVIHMQQFEDDNGNVPALKKQKMEQPCAIPYLSVVPECRKRVQRMTTLMQTEDVSIGDLVQLSTSFHPDRLRGVVRFIGEVHALRYTYDRIFGHNYFGIELFVAEGDNDGTIEKEYYFHAEPKHGVFVKRDKIEKLSLFGHHYFGIELFGAEGDTDGTIEKEYYFHAEPKHGIFVKRNKIEKIITLNWSVPRLTIDDVIHMQQFACNGKIRYIGQRYGDDGSRPEPECIDYGIELSQPRGDNNGCINDVIYFSACPSKCGIFLNNRYLSDLLVLRKSHLLLCGFLRHACVDFIPNDILCAMSEFFRFIRIVFYKSIRVITTLNDIRSCDIYDVFGMDGEIIGPMICKTKSFEHFESVHKLSAESQRVGKIIIQNLARKTDTDDDDNADVEDEDIDWSQMFQDAAEQYGVSSVEMSNELSNSQVGTFNSLNFTLSFKDVHLIQR
eukprot:CAMPEP_0202731196 /NCGR_PEP_ID=MMETSP1385-20130828/187022_1 /ASSEMBLY_ACC=CAM_ASM_000861 /TAXON_ID=933848 /ORGANISM="Elphidium margaritaceum" /LENGTH=614 /DNA_ID=CAMNT_0049397485 /DNA_START=2332 /DNA_END=4177 /DNA_ORIENTATION=-